jgi:plasmid rolling circle replication initiator protein Rep
MGKMQDKKEKDLLEVFAGKKKVNEKIAEYMQGRLSSRAWDYFKDCNTYMELITTADKKHKKQVYGNTCKNRFCPVCMYRKALKDAMKLSVIMTAIVQEEGKEFIFLTLTIPNVAGEKLPHALDLINSSFKRMKEKKRVSSVVKGFVKKIEVTHNAQTGMFHPHLHVLIAVNRSYFTSRNYISHEEWLDLWRKATRMTGVTEKGTDEITQVHIQKVKNSRAPLEMSKYVSKDLVDIDVDERTFDYYYGALKGRRLVGYSGVFLEYSKKFDADELDKYKKQDTNIYVLFCTSSWIKGSYTENYSEMSAEQIKQWNSGHKTVRD